MYITTEGVNFRESPNGNILGSFTIGTEVTFLDSTDDIWAYIDYRGHQGFVVKRYLRDNESNGIEALLKATIHEWVRFNKGDSYEKSDPYCDYVGEMWAALKQPYDGTSIDEHGNDIAWSAAFVSWVVGEAQNNVSAYSNFLFSIRHSEFVNDSIGARFKEDISKPFWGYRINEQMPTLGDIIQRNRIGGSVSFSYAENHSQYESHSDIVVEVTSDVVRVIGGNVNDSVRIKEYGLDSEGYILENQGIISLLKNRT
ncbi:MAG: DUF2272 domain-containing protein [Acinetobacter sp.]|uniref:DUF2272 domain-containing protein n=1 Tax=Anaerorhabdus sp. TaxID=1872524 RepID=UPI002FC5D0C0